jgi:hypothetical protein
MPASQRNCRSSRLSDHCTDESFWPASSFFRNNHRCQEHTLSALLCVVTLRPSSVVQGSKKCAAAQGTRISMVSQTLLIVTARGWRVCGAILFFPLVPMLNTKAFLVLVRNDTPLTNQILFPHTPEKDYLRQAVQTKSYSLPTLTASWTYIPVSISKTGRFGESILSVS